MTTEYFGALMPVLMILALFVLIALLFQRLGKKTYVKSGLLSIQENVPIGANERLVLVEIADKWILLGVTTGSINTLMTLDSPPTIVNKQTNHSSMIINSSWFKKYRFKSND
jgi:flagellar biosynthetic protein FliO